MCGPSAAQITVHFNTATALSARPRNAIGRLCVCVCVCVQATVLKQQQHTRPFNGHFSETTLVSRYQKGRTNLDLTEARDSEWQWHQLSHMHVCTSLQTDNHASTPPLSYRGGDPQEKMPGLNSCIFVHFRHKYVLF